MMVAVVVVVVWRVTGVGSWTYLGIGIIEGGRE